MTLDEAREILKDAIAKDGGLDDPVWYLGWNPGQPEATLDGDFTADQLEAIAIYMRQHASDLRSLEMTRAYTVNELDALRNATKARYIFGTTRPLPHGHCSRTFSEGEIDLAVEEMVRTYMVAGITAEDIYAADNPPNAANNEASTKEK